MVKSSLFGRIAIHWALTEIFALALNVFLKYFFKFLHNRNRSSWSIWWRLCGYMLC